MCAARETLRGFIAALCAEQHMVRLFRCSERGNREPANEEPVSTTFFQGLEPRRRFRPTEGGPSRADLMHLWPERVPRPTIRSGRGCDVAAPPEGHSA